MEIEKETESIKLVKNAKGDFQYEIKLRGEEVNEETVSRLDKLQKQLEEKYGAR